jgi:hypothetical protein
MKRDLGIIMIHWMMVVILLGTAITGLCLWYRGLQPYLAFIFVPKNMGVIHISLSAAVIAILIVYLSYLKHKNFFGHIALRWREIHWKHINIFLYWILFFVVITETVTGILLTKLIDKETLFQVFYIQKPLLLFLHLYLVYFIFAFPMLHFFVHWKAGGRSLLLSIFRPALLPNRPTLIDVLSKLKNENLRLKEKAKSDH